MGSWSVDILGSDDSLDACGMLEKALGWDYEKRGFIYAPKSKAGFKKLMRTRAARTAFKAFFDSLTPVENPVSILAIVEVMLQHGIKIDPDVEIKARKAITYDPWGQEGDPARVSALDDFRRRLDKAVGRSSGKAWFKVEVRRTVEFSTTVTVAAISAKAAQDNALERFNGTPAACKGFSVSRDHTDVRHITEIPSRTYG